MHDKTLHDSQCCNLVLIYDFETFTYAHQFAPPPPPLLYCADEQTGGLSQLRTYRLLVVFLKE